MNPPTIDDLIKCATREAAMRRRVYPNAQMAPDTKERELRCMDSIVTLLGALKDNRAALDLLAGSGFRYTDNPEMFPS